MAVTVRPVVGRRELAAFVNLPFELYRRDPLWVPPLKASVRGLLDVERHPFYDQGRGADRELFLAWDNGRPLGRVAAILNHAHNRFQDEQVAFFGFFECVNDQAVARSLLSAAEAWAAGQGATAVRGPANPSTNYEAGLLVEGFERPPVLMMTYNPPYYVELIEAAGYTGVKDLYAYWSEVHGAHLERLHRLAVRTRSRHPQLQTRGANLKDFHGEVALVQEVYNSAWEENWGFVPMSDAEIEAMAQELKPLVQPELLRFAMYDGEPAGFLLAVPDWNPVLGDLEGSPWRHPLRTLRHQVRTRPEKLEGLRLITLGVKSKYRKRGFEGVLFAEGLQHALDLGFRWCEYSWILEDNELTKRTVRLMDAELYKVYRMYEKEVRGR
jgi:GNAT superfamily N-acetyltransferase